MEWNVVVSIYQEGFRRVVRSLRDLGAVERTKYHNVLVVAAEDPLVLLEQIEQRTRADPALYDAISRVAPSMQGFAFDTAEEFEKKAIAAMKKWLPQLGGRTFHVRLHRRGIEHHLSPAHAEQLLGDALLDALKRQGTPGSISFSDPDAVIAIDTVDDRAGLSLWTREDLSRYKMLRPD
jgi:tRNA(Ser,Leu) C12 N-acetylase TAN1